MPEINVPVTTVPNPLAENARSMGSRKWPAALFSTTCQRHALQFAAQVVDSGAGGRADGTMGAPSRNEPGDELLHLQAHEIEDVLVNEIGL